MKMLRKGCLSSEKQNFKPSTNRKQFMSWRKNFHQTIWQIYLKFMGSMKFENFFFQNLLEFGSPNKLRHVCQFCVKMHPQQPNHAGEQSLNRMFQANLLLIQTHVTLNFSTKMTVLSFSRNISIRTQFKIFITATLSRSKFS